MAARPFIGDGQRRARLALRHGLASGARFDGPADVADGLVALHATDTPTVHLSIAARVERITTDETTNALGEGRVLHRQMAMRRTQWVATDPVVDEMLPGPAARTAGPERRRLHKELKASGVTVDPQRWLRRAEADLLAALAAGTELTAAEIAATSPRLARRVALSPGTKWETQVGVTPRLITVLWAEGKVARGVTPGDWLTNRATWTTPEQRRGDRSPLPEPEEAWARLVQRWLERFGPGTELDLVWWLGGTTKIARDALRRVGATEVDLDGGQVGWVAAGDEDDVPDPGRWAALLPVLDPSTMGHKQRAFYTNGHDADLYDSRGNGGTTAWVDGRMVGSWSTTDDGLIRLHLLDDVDPEALALLEERAGALEAFIGGRKVTGVYSSPLVAGILREERAGRAPRNASQ